MKTQAADIFARAFEMEVEAREAYLQGACGEDAELRLEVQRLLVDAEKADSYFADAGGEAATLIPEIDTTYTEAEGDQIGSYTLRQQIGEGGFGTVWMAEQSEPISRMVALKVVKAGMDTKQVLSRFEAERQAVAMMDHPNIAKVLDAGATPAGRPYFAMELVKGIPITEFCEQQKFGPRRRLELFRDVCSAVNHAHQKGIIHRDLKPSNIMVTLAADVPVVKVIDFGIAKATHSKLTEKTLFTRFEQFLGTPVYMSPEQAAMSAIDVDTRSDIYSLGVLLYELLAGAPPFDQKSLLSAGYDEMRRIIAEDEPPKPSTRLTETQAASGADARPAKISPSTLKGELDWIVMKALEKDRSRRYETANAFAADIGRYLADEPVLAAAPSTAYKFKKFARRNKAAFGVATAMVLLLLVGIATTSWQAVRATGEAERANEAEDLAKQRLVESEEAREEAEGISKFLTGMFESTRPGEEGRDVRVADKLDEAVTDLHTLPADRRAKLQATIGTTYYALGLYPKAIELQEKARDYLVQTLGLEHPDTLKVMTGLAVSYKGAGRFDEAIALGEQVLERYRKMRGDEHPEAITSKSNLALFYRSGGRLDEAMAMQREVLELRTRVHGPKCTPVVDAMNNLAGSLFLDGQRDEALEMWEKVVEVRREFLGPKHPETLAAMLNLATSYHAAGRHEDAVVMGEKVLELSREVRGPEHPHTLEVMNNLAAFYDSADRLQDALAMGEEVLKLFRDVSGAAHPATIGAMGNLADWYRKDGRLDEALALAEEALELSRKVNGPEHPDTLTAMAGLANCHSDAGRVDDALAMREEVLKLRQKVLGEEHPDTLGSMHHVGISYRHAGRLHDALALWEALVGLNRKVRGPEHLDTLRAIVNLTAAYHDLGLMAKALAKGAEAWDLSRKVHGPEHPDTLLAMLNLTNISKDAGRVPEAVAMGEELLELSPGVLGEEHPMTLKGMVVLANTYLAAHRPDDARKLLEEVLECGKKVLGPEHPDMLAAMNNLALAYRLTDRADEGCRIYRELLGLSRDVHGPEHPLTLSALSGLALACRYADRADEAVKYGEEALRLHREVYGREHPKTLGEMTNLAICLGGAGMHDQALELDEEVLALKKKIIGLTHRDTLGAMTNLAVAHARLDRFDRAIALLEEVVPLKEKHLLPGDPFIKFAVGNLALCYEKTGRLDKASELAAKWATLRGWLPLTDEAPEVAAVLVAPDSTWRWLHPTDGVDPKESDRDFHQTFFTGSFDDTSWETGKDSEGPERGFGYGDDSFKGVDIGSPTEKDLGKSAYFRHRFTTAKAHANLELRCQRDDGIIVYLDGVEVARHNMSKGSEAYLLPAAEATGVDKRITYRIPLDGVTPPAGEHLLAISLHNPATPSSDLRIGGITLVELEEQE